MLQRIGPASQKRLFLGAGRNITITTHSNTPIAISRVHLFGNLFSTTFPAFLFCHQFLKTTIAKTRSVILFAFFQGCLAELACLSRVQIAVITQTRHPAQLFHWDLFAATRTFFLAFHVTCVAKPRCPNLVLWNCDLASCAGEVAVNIASITKSQRWLLPGYSRMAAPTPVVAVVADACAPAQFLQTYTRLAKPALLFFFIVAVITQTSTPAHLPQRDCLLAVFTLLLARIITAVAKSCLEPNLGHPEFLCTALTFWEI